MPIRGQMLFVFIRIFEGQPRNISAAITHDAGADQLIPKKRFGGPSVLYRDEGNTGQCLSWELGRIDISPRGQSAILALVLPIGQNAKMLGPLKG